jgi:hypothetical protein
MDTYSGFFLRFLIERKSILLVSLGLDSQCKILSCINLAYVVAKVCSAV